MNRTLLYQSVRNGLLVQFSEHAMPTRNCIDVACAVQPYNPQAPGWSLVYDIALEIDVNNNAMARRVPPFLDLGEFVPEPIPPLININIFQSQGGVMTFELEALYGVLPFAGVQLPSAKMKILQAGIIVFEIILNGTARTVLGVVRTGLFGDSRSVPENDFNFLIGPQYTVVFEELTP